MRTLQSTRRMVQASLLTALAVILSIWPKFPIFPAVSWMKFEFSDIPVLIGGFALGPWYALGITVIKAVLNGLLTGDANYIGHIMNIVSTGVPTMLAALLYGRLRSRKGAYWAFGLFLVSQVLVMIPMNYFVGSLNFNLILGIAPDYATARSMMAPLLIWVGLFNLIKSTATVITTGILYKPLSLTVLDKEQMQTRIHKEPQENLDNPM